MRLTRRVELSAQPAQVWAALADTDRLNRAFGLPPVEYTPPQPGGVVRGARSYLLGPFALEWDEHPFDWSEGKRFTIERVYHGGPLARFGGAVNIEPAPGGCVLTLEGTADPRWPIAGPLARLFCSKFLDLYEAAARKAAQTGRPDTLLVMKERDGVDRGLLRRALTGLAGRADPEALERIAGHLGSADDAEVGFMRPFALADDWGLDRMAVLRAFLLATKAGLLDLRWELLCPNCRVSKSSVATLKAFHAQGRCEFCNTDFTGELDENVELRFSPNAAVRAVSPKDFCIGGPGKPPHRLAQVRLCAGGERTEALSLKPQRYVLRGLASTWRRTLVPDPQGPARVLAAAAQEAAELRFCPGEVSLTLENPSRAEAWAVVETESWSDKAVTAAFVTTLQDFRDMFSSEVLAPGREVSLKTLSLLFTDLKGSTAMYERVGDARAYAVVRDHFDVLFEAVRRRRGAVIKTIGDAVMAAFLDPGDAVAAALDMHAGLIARAASMPEPVVLKVGVHSGPAIAINAEGILDYFGTTVNLAARIQAESTGGDIVVSRAVLADPRAAAALEAAGGTREEFETTVKGLSAPVALTRLRPQACLDAGLGPS